VKSEKFPSADRQAYYVQARSWAEDMNRSLRLTRRLALMAAAVAATIAILEAIALVLLMPLKTVVPYTITVDRQTGYLETAPALKPGALSQDVAVTDAFLAQYVMARETFDVTDVQDNYQKVAAWSTGTARTEYIAAMQRSNPQSPENVNPPGTILKTVVKSITLLSPTTALVRFDSERDNGTAQTQRQPYTAAISFHYTGQPMRMADRFLNPLGFEVSSYRRDAETTGPVADPVTRGPLP
jgi:type IV secretion system protein VirB8